MAALTHGHPKQQVSQWNAQMLRAPGTGAAASAIYLPVGLWPAAGARLAAAHFDVALATALWAGHFPPLTQATPVPAWVAPVGHVLLAPVLAVTCWTQLPIMTHSIPPH